MSRHPKFYKKEIEVVRNMSPGDVIVFDNLTHPWGLAKKIYEFLRKWYVEKYYDLRIDKKGGKVTVIKEGIHRVIDEDDYEIVSRIQRRKEG